jgi:hypothetical protein
VPHEGVESTPGEADGDAYKRLRPSLEGDHTGRRRGRLYAVRRQGWLPRRGGPLVPDVRAAEGGGVSGDLDLRPIEAMLAMLGALDEAQGHATWLDHGLPFA